MTGDDLISELNNHLGRVVTVTVQFLNETPLAAMAGTLRPEFGVLRAAGSDVARSPLEDTWDARATFHVGDGSFMVPHDVAAELTDVGVNFTLVRMNVETVVDWTTP